MKLKQTLNAQNELSIVKFEHTMTPSNTYNNTSGFGRFILDRINVSGLIVFVSLFLLISCENDIAKIKSLAAAVDLPALTAEGFETLTSDSSVIRIKMVTPELIMHSNEKDPYTEFPKGVKIEKYDAKMNIVSSITAQYAKYFNSESRWEAKNNVVAVNLQGDTLKTEYLVYDDHKQKIYSDQFVKIIRKDQIITGVGFESNQDFTSYHIKNPTGHVYVDVGK